MGLEEDFQAAAKEITEWNITSDDDQLELYGYYKQATAGDNTTDKPGLLNFVAKRKWQAWTDKKGLSKEDAMKAYIECCSKFKAQYQRKATAPAPA